MGTNLLRFLEKTRVQSEGEPALLFIFKEEHTVPRWRVRNGGREREQVRTL
jgi:hypothetical protein